MKLQELATIAGNFPLREKTMPLLFIGHGHPMNALWDNDFTRTLTKLGQSLDFVLNTNRRGTLNWPGN
jgi:4,5-DOPA dioxygenase extradiol